MKLAITCVLLATLALVSCGGSSDNTDTYQPEARNSTTLLHADGDLILSSYGEQAKLNDVQVDVQHQHSDVVILKTFRGTKGKVNLFQVADSYRCDGDRPTFKRAWLSYTADGTAQITEVMAGDTWNVDPSTSTRAAQYQVTVSGTSKCQTVSISDIVVLDPR